MSFHKSFALALALAAGIGFASAANADEAKLTDCLHMAKQVSSVLSTSEGNPNLDKARDLAKNARSFCSAKMYDRGVALYSKAYEMLTKS